MNKSFSFTRHSRQNGLALLLCLIFMTSLTLLGLTAASDTIIQTQLAANLQDAERARQTALLSLEWAENWLMDLAGAAPPVCSSNCTGFYAHPPNSLTYSIQSQPLAWWTANGIQVGLDPASGVRLATIGNSASNPSIWIVQSLHQEPASTDGSSPELHWYRIVVRSTGHSSKTVSVLESIVKIAWNNNGSAAFPARRVAWQELR